MFRCRFIDFVIMLCDMVDTHWCSISLFTIWSREPDEACGWLGAAAACAEAFTIS